MDTDKKERDYSRLVPPGMLEADEKVIFASRPQQFYYFFRSCLITLVLLAGGLALILVDRLNVKPARITGAVLILAGLLFISLHILRWRKTIYGFTNRRLFRHRGIIAKDLYEMPLSRIQDIRVTISISQRLIGCGDIFITTAGTETPVFHWDDIPRPLKVKDLIHAHINAQANSQSPPPSV